MKGKSGRCADSAGGIIISIIRAPCRTNVMSPVVLIDLFMEIARTSLTLMPVRINPSSVWRTISPERSKNILYFVRRLVRRFASTGRVPATTSFTKTSFLPHICGAEERLHPFSCVSRSYRLYSTKTVLCANMITLLPPRRAHKLLCSSLLVIMYDGKIIHLIEYYELSSMQHRSFALRA